MKAIKAGQIHTINGVVYRARKRTNGCRGCAFNNVLLCPNVVDRRFSEPKLSCQLNDIILVRL